MQFLSDTGDALKGKKVIVRTNFDVPIKDGHIGDTTRLEANLATIRFLLERRCRPILIAHQDRPGGQFVAAASLAPIAAYLTSTLGIDCTLVPYQTVYRQSVLPDSAPCLLLDNLRFWPGEKANDPQFSAWLAGLGEAYVNEAFANCHRAHASIVGVPALLPAYAGITLSAEVQALSRVLQTPKKPLVIVIGGAKLETKEPLVTAFANTADTILVGGKLALDFKNRASGLPPNVILADLIPDGKDITEASAIHFAQIIRTAGTVFWNGTMGITEDPAYRLGTQIVAQSVSTTSAFTVIGGGDTEAALTELKLEQGIDHISTGGGALLEYLCRGSLIGLKALG